MRRVLFAPMLMAVVAVVAALGGRAGAAKADQAATITVPCSASALVSAINTANATPGADTLSLASGCTYTLTAVDNGHNGLPIISSEITIVGNGATITRAQTAPAFRILSVASGGTLSLENVTISNGLANADCPQGTSAMCGGGIANGGTLSVDSSTITGNTVRGVFPHHCTESNPACSAEGGAINNTGTVTIAGSEISGNFVDATSGTAGNGDSGAIISYGHLTISASSVAANRVVGSNDAVGGGMEVDPPGTLTMQNTRVTGNSVAAAGRFAAGGGLAVFDTVLRISGSVVADNSVSGAGEQAHGGGILNRSDASIDDTLVEDNTTRATGVGGAAVGGGIDTVGIKGKLNLTHSWVIDNKTIGSVAQVGGVGALGVISDTVVRGNIVQVNGPGDGVAGGIGVYGQLTLTNSSVQDNEVLAPNGSASSGGIHLFRDIATLTATGTSIVGNSVQGADAHAGGIHVRPGTSLTLISSPVNGNSVNGTSALGGGIANTGGSAELTDSPVTNNSATGASAEGGGLFNDGGSFVLNSSPVQHNVPDNCFPLGSISGCTG